MTALILIIVGAVMMLAAAVFPPLTFAVFGDEIPDWLEDWAPALAVIGCFIGLIILFAGLGLLVVAAL